MSRIYFHSPSATAELRGSERAWMGTFCNDLMVAAFGGLRFDTDWIKALLPRNCWALQSRDPDHSLRLYLTSFEGRLIVDDEEIETFGLALNTAWAIGGDPVRLMARLHGQCEIHCWVAGRNRKWLAEIMEAGRASGLYRENQGWEGVIEFLLSRADEPVVCSYSVCEQFPNFGCLPSDHPLKARDDDDRYDAFYELPDEEKWSLCFRGLMEKGPGWEMKPRGWNTFFFDRGRTVFTLPRKKTIPAGLGTPA